MSDYPGPDRRAFNRQEVSSMIAEELDKRFTAIETNLINHINSQIAQVNEKMGTLAGSITTQVSTAVQVAIEDHVDEAFPPGPLHKHKEQHQKHIDAAANAKRIWQDIQLWAVRGVLLFLASLLLLGANEWFAREMSKIRPPAERVKCEAGDDKCR